MEASPLILASIMTQAKTKVDLSHRTNDDLSFCLAIRHVTSIPMAISVVEQVNPKLTLVPWRRYNSIPRRGNRYG